jgi:glutamate-1-semialdehyde 2,1-aminomutase
MVARCAQQPFFSYDDWFIASTPIVKGIPSEHLAQVRNFNYNDIESLNNLITEFPHEIACVILEPASIECPGRADTENICTGTIDCPTISNCKRQNFLQKVQETCNRNGIVFILDEMITGFRWDLKGAQNYFNVKPDLSTFGKAMANGFSVSCVAGKREIMQQGSIEFEDEERLFLLSTTHGAEMSGLGAFVETVNFIKENDSITHLWKYGKSLANGMNGIAKDLGIEKYFKVGGFSCSPYYQTLDLDEQPSLDFRTLFSQEMINNGVLMPWMALAYRHDEIILERTLAAVSAALMKYSDALEFGFDKLLVGPSIKPVFRKFN